MHKEEIQTLEENVKCFSSCDPTAIFNTAALLYGDTVHNDIRK